jgi:hypothetical protein
MEKLEYEYESMQDQDLSALFGDSVSQESLQNFLADCAENENVSDAQGSLVSIITFAFKC